MMMNLLEMSTSHLSAETCEHLDHNDIPAILMFRREDGWLINVDPDHEREGGWEDLPADLHACLVYARTCGADYILFDVDVLGAPLPPALYGEVATAGDGPQMVP